MDWLNELTSRLSLKKSFSIYLLVFFIPGFILGGLLRLLLENIKFQHLSASLAQGKSLTFFSSFIVSKFYILLTDTILAFTVALFLFLGFTYFYQHKIKESLTFLQELGLEDEALSQNELLAFNDQAKQLLSDYEKERISFVFQLHHLRKRTDTLLHELRNPLATLRGDLELLSLSMDRKDEKAEEILLRMQRSEKRMEKYLEKLTEKEQLHDLYPSLEKVSLEKFWREIKTKYENNSIRIEFVRYPSSFSPSSLMIDPAFFHEALGNILDNANRFAQAIIQMELIETEDTVILYILDDGKGFSSDALQLYDQAYYSEDLGQGNLGLGLHISSILLQKQGIKMIASNRLGACLELHMKKFF